MNRNRSGASGNGSLGERIMRLEAQRIASERDGRHADARRYREAANAARKETAHAQQWHRPDDNGPFDSAYWDQVARQQEDERNQQ